MEDQQLPGQKAQMSITELANKTADGTDKYHAKDSLRMIVDGALAGTCIAMIITMLTLQKLDKPLLVALYAFTITLPLLAWSFMNVYEEKPGETLLFTVKWIHRGAEYTEALGWLSFCVGLSCVFLHFSLSLFLVFTIMIAIVFLSQLLFIMLAFIEEAKKRYQEEEKKKQAPAQM